MVRRRAFRPIKKDKKIQIKKEESINQEGRIRRWKAEKEKMRIIVREKNKECWKKFCEENREKDSWEVVK